MPDHYNKKPTGGMPLPPNLMDEAKSIAAEQDKIADDMMTSASPQGQFSVAPMNILIKSVNDILTTLFDTEPVVEVGDDTTMFPVDLTTKLTMIDKAAKDARVDFDIDFDSITDDRAVQMLAGELDILAADKDFKRYLQDNTLLEDMPVVEEESVIEEEPEASNEDMNDLFASRM